MTLTRITSDGITDSTIATADLADQSVTLAKLPHGTSSNNGKFLRANNGADPTFESVITDLVNDTSPQLGGTLDLNGNQINGGDSNASSTNIILLGAGNDLQLYHDGNSHVNHNNGSGYLYLQGDAIKLRTRSATGNETYIACSHNGAVSLYYDNSLKFETTSGGVKVTGSLGGDDNTKLKSGTNDDLQFYHDGSNSYIDNYTGNFEIRSNEFRVKSLTSTEPMIHATKDAEVRLYYDNVKKFETQEVGANFYGRSVDCQLRLKTSDGTTRGNIYAYNDNSIAFLDAAGSYSFRANSDKTVTFFNHGLPNANNSYDLGSSSYRWRNVYLNHLTISGNVYGALIPNVNNNNDLGTSSLRWRNIYTNDLNLSNEGSSNDVDATWGSYTIQEGAEDLFLINKRNGKKYKFNLTEVA